MSNRLPAAVRVLRNATLQGGETADVVLDGPVVAQVVPAGTTAGSDHDDGVLDLTGFVLLPAAAEPHAHLDKSRTWELARPPEGDLVQAIEQFRAFVADETVESIAARARATALDLLTHGVTAIRSHVDLLPGDQPLRGVRALLAVREELRDLVDIELVALADDKIPTETFERALELGVDLIGGAPHLTPDPPAELDRLLSLAERLGRSVDLHTDENLDGALTIVRFARRVATWTSAHATAGHCVRLGTLPLDELRAVIDEVVAADLGVISLPITNLYLQGWQQPVATPRGLTALRPLIEAGARLAAGADNVRDPFNPVGRCDPFETVSLLVTAGHLSIAEAYHLVSEGARAVMRLPAAGPQPGAQAEFLAVRGRSLAEAAATADPNRHVIHRGMLVASSTCTVDIATPASRDRVSV